MVSTTFEKGTLVKDSEKNTLKALGIAREWTNAADQMQLMEANMTSQLTRDAFAFVCSATTECLISPNDVLDLADRICSNDLDPESTQRTLQLDPLDLAMNAVVFSPGETAVMQTPRIIQMADLAEKKDESGSLKGFKEQICLAFCVLTTHFMTLVKPRKKAILDAYLQRIENIRQGGANARPAEAKVASERHAGSRAG